MTEVDLVIRRESASPKCFNCHHYTRLPVTDALGRCALGDCIVQDIAVCSAWVRAADPQIEVRRVERKD